MNDSHEEGSEATGRRRWPLVILGVVASVVYSIAARSVFVDYDGYWHVFIATLSDSSEMYREIVANAHPPLFYFLLRPFALFGDTPLAYRLVSIAAAVAMIAVISGLFRTLRVGWWSSLTGVVLWTFSGVVLVMALEVRSYMLAAFFTVMALLAWLKSTTGGRRSAKWNSIFALAATLAVGTHYSSVFAVLAVVIVTAGSLLVSRSARLQMSIGLALALTLPCAVFAALFVSHPFLRSSEIDYMAAFYYQPQQQSFFHFVATNTYNVVKLFAPIDPGPAGALIIVALFAALLVSALFLRPAAERRAFALYAAAVCVQVVLLVIAASAKKYPFGGVLRHQFFLFTPAVICLIAALDTLLARIHREVLIATNVVLCSAALLHFAITFVALRENSVDPRQRELTTYFQSFAPVRAAYADKYSFMRVYAHLARHDWEYRGRISDAPHVAWFTLKEGDSVVAEVFRDTGRWNIDFSDPAVYNDVKVSAKTTASETIDIVALSSGRVRDTSGSFRGAAETAASASGFDVVRLLPIHSDVFMRLQNR